MGNDDYLTDDYVADLLAKEAKDCSLKYSAMGMEAFTSSSKKPANAPKPNTRFLRHIIKNTDTHNKNLLAKEEAESKARLKDLERSEEVKRLKTNPNSRDIRRRQMGDIHAILGGKKPKKQREESSSTTTTTTTTKDSDQRARKSRDEISKQSDDLFSSRSSQKQHGRLAEDDEEYERSRESSSRRHRRSSHSNDEGRSSRRERHKRDRSRSPRRRRRSRSPDSRSRRHRHRSPVRSKRTPPASPAGDDSDPLEDLIGPQPAPKPRGRGAVSGSSGIDRRFSETYDPTKDIEMGGQQPEGGDWDDEVEAFRDRQKLKQAQEQRLRSAGFGDDEIKKIEKGGERSEEDVRWSKAGVRREWDMGKEEDE